jgi:Ala-tRNA(Pro) deacylase
MAIAQAVENYLRVHELPYDTIKHPKAVSATHVAEAAHVPGDRLAKSVLLQDANGYVVAVLPSTHKLHLGKLRNQFNRMLGLATEDEISDLFSDCDSGAIPAVGHAYDVTTVIDDSLLEQPDVYFEAGDHEALIHMNGRDFRALMADLPHGHFTYRS